MKETFFNSFWHVAPGYQSSYLTIDRMCFNLYFPKNKRNTLQIDISSTSSVHRLSSANTLLKVSTERIFLPEAQCRPTDLLLRRVWWRTAYLLVLSKPLFFGISLRLLCWFTIWAWLESASSIHFPSDCSRLQAVRSNRVLWLAHFYTMENLYQSDCIRTLNKWMVDGIKARKKVALREKPQDMNIDIATDIIMILSFFIRLNNEWTW